MFKLKKIIKLFVFIIIIKTSFLVSFAFIGDNLGLDLYRNIDKGITDLNEKMYTNELKGGTPDGDITEQVNNFIQKSGINGCKLSTLTEKDVKVIAYGFPTEGGNITLLAEKLDGKCSTIDQLTNIQQIIKNYLDYSLDNAEQKSDAIYNISKIGIFSDGNLDNSPFDIVKDIEDIDYIIFTQKVEYVGNENVGENDVSKYLNDKFNDINIAGSIDKPIDILKNIDPIKKILDKNDEKKDGKKDKGNNKNLDDKKLDKKKGVTDNKNEGQLPTLGTKTENFCPIDLENESGLSQKDLNNILKSNNGSNKSGGANTNGGVNNYNNNNGIINGNFNGDFGLGDNAFSFNTGNNDISAGGNIGSQIGTNKYNKTNDNDYFGGCETFFCITVEEISHQGNTLMGSTTRSIESIMQRSNDHLKKFVNSSLAQSKMTTNNFELGLRDLSLADMFSMPMVITKKSPPILDLDHFNEKVSKDIKDKKLNDPKPFGWGNLLKSRFEAQGINIRRENDLSIYTNYDEDIKLITINAEMGLSSINKNIKNLEKSGEQKDITDYGKLTKLDNHISRIIQTNYQTSETEGLYKEFIEFERFSSEIQNYVNNAEKTYQKMLEIPVQQ